MYYDIISGVIYTLLFWWVILLFFQRATNRYPVRNTWKKDIILTFIQSVVILLLLPVLVYFLRDNM
ncbi:hypothetical protein [Fredinandcohnia quinoae]|uniref:Uncharacterized protein n=1 Tax=Fredinandcohnia quinoae TaxID=2918902 RepID=A0AAW5E978_9BACI|nr:hypothetical protein [Fredinandcohnia sp. SECRCQ15]MCH1626452.1 hypothetical protein [Fredinandcohnia sp. SECRCQ15]